MQYSGNGKMLDASCSACLDLAIRYRPSWPAGSDAKEQQ